MNKSILRKKYKELRNNMSKEEVSVRSQSILQNLASHPLWAKSSTIMCFLSLGNEVETKPIIARAWEENKQVVIPVCQTESRTIIPSLLTSFQHLEPKTMGILEPKEGKLYPVDPKIIDLCLIPGLAFDLEGHRIGFGAGYYDRFLPLLKPGTPKMALAFDFQISPQTLPHEAHDVKLDFICTEKKVYTL